ncbi:MAG TPA: ATP-binding cassette domain-containing protein [Clostridia bacterium]|nr:ATP-binding cassette domain-containing protein [Clostridia bacterium]
MIEAKEVHLQYLDGTMALNDLSFVVNPGELVYVLGPSGSGKTSLLKLLLGIEYPSKGDLRVLGQTITRPEFRAIRGLRRKIGLVGQDFNLINGRSVLENVMLGTRILGMPPGQMRNEARSALIRVGLEHKFSSLVENLSWGERQRVAIARAVARYPKLILADEPTGNLDKDNALKVLGLLSSFVDNQTTVIITTHATHLIDLVEDYRCIELNQGKIIRDTKGCL